MKFIRLCNIKSDIFYQTNQLVSVKRVSGRIWKLTFSDNKEYEVYGEDYFTNFEFMKDPTKRIYDIMRK